MSSEILPRKIPALRPGQTGGKRDENRRQKTQHLCSCALKLFLDRGIEGVTIDEIVKSAHMAKGSFYRYFQDTTDLVVALFSPMRRLMEEAFTACESALLHTASSQDVSAAYQLLAQQMGAAILMNPEVALLYLQECRSPAVSARVPIRELADLIRQKAIALTHIAHERGLLRPFDARVSALAVVGAVERLLFGALSHEDIGTPQEVPVALISLILDGLRVHPLP